MKHIVFYAFQLTFLTLVAWGITAILGVHLDFWPLVGLSALTGEFISLASAKVKDIEEL